MPQKKTSQPEIDITAKPERPRMLEGYFAPHSNPALAQFVARFGKPFANGSDMYDVPPFGQPITTTKATSIYNMHTYWSKKPHDAIRQYIQHYTQLGDLILDPFCGSGGTALAALMEGRAAVAIDLSPAATFITRNYCTPVDPDELRKAFERLRAAVKSEIDSLYETKCDRCEGRATIAYTVFSQVYRCERCLSEVPLFDCVDVEGQTRKGKAKTINACPICYAQGITEEIRTGVNEKVALIPVLTSYECQEGCKPKRVLRRHNDPDERKRAFFRRHDLAKLQQVSTAKPSCRYWYPTVRMMNASTDQERWGMLWRPYHAGIETAADFYTDRNLIALATLLDGINRASSCRDPLLFAFTSILYKCSKMMVHNDNGSGSILKGTLYVPPVIHEANVWRLFEVAIADLIEGYRALNIRSNALLISTDDARSLKLPDNSVDYIFTDPPYSWKVQFGESNFLWEAWLRLDSSWLQDEIIVNDFRHKQEGDWHDAMLRALSECYRVLKPNRWLSICYHDTSEGTWQLLQDMMAEIGFIPDTLSGALYIETSQKSFKQITAHQVAKRDLVINFRKPRPGELAELALRGDEDQGTFVEQATAFLRDLLIKHPGSRLDRLYDELVSRMVRLGSFERHEFEPLLRGIAEESDGRWYLLETADQIDEAENRKEDAAAELLQDYIERMIATDPGRTGAHYSDLFEQYLPIKDKPRRELRDWLRDYLYQTPERTWRPPIDEEERREKAALRQTGLLRRVKRFANALIEGVPPSARDVPENAATAAEWLRQCRRAALHDQGRAIYEKGGFAWSTLPSDIQLDVTEDYQLCARRGNRR